MRPSKLGSQGSLHGREDQGWGVGEEPESILFIDYFGMLNKYAVFESRITVGTSLFRFFSQKNNFLVDSSGSQTM